MLCFEKVLIKKMAVEEKQTEINIDEQTAEEFPHELRLPIWSVVSFEKREAVNLTYSEAEQKLAELETQKVSGLCIVTDETAARIADKT